MDRRAQLLRMKDILEHLGDCYEQWHSVEPGSQMLLADMMKRDLDQCRRLCESLRRESQSMALANQAAMI